MIVEVGWYWHHRENHHISFFSENLWSLYLILLPLSSFEGLKASKETVGWQSVISALVTRIDNVVMNAKLKSGFPASLLTVFVSYLEVWESFSSREELGSLQRWRERVKSNFIVNFLEIQLGEGGPPIRKTKCTNSTWLDQKKSNWNKPHVQIFLIICKETHPPVDGSRALPLVLSYKNIPPIHSLQILQSAWRGRCWHTLSLWILCWFYSEKLCLCNV